MFRIMVILCFILAACEREKIEPIESRLEPVEVDEEPFEPDEPHYDDGYLFPPPEDNFDKCGVYSLLFVECPYLS